MKTKELKNLAQKIAKAEFSRQQATEENEINRLEDEIIKLSGKISNINDMLLIDDYIQDYLKDLQSSSCS